MLRDGVDEILELPFRLLAIVDVGARGKPAGDSSFVVPQRLTTNEKPAVLPIFPEYSRLDLPAFAVAHGCFAHGVNSFQVVCMKGSGPEVVRLEVFQGKTEIIEQAIVCINRAPIR